MTELALHRCAWCSRLQSAWDGGAPEGWGRVLWTVDGDLTELLMCSMCITQRVAKPGTYDFKGLPEGRLL